MAECYHDKQDFKTDLNIEVARECDMLQEGQDLKDRKCDKNPGHQGFIPFKDLTLEHLPIEDRNREVLDSIKKIGNVVVRVVLDKKAGSGCLFKSKNKYCIRTNNHVVKTDDEVKHCTVEFHYDDDSRSNVLTSRGVELLGTCPYRDITVFRFDPVHDFLYQLDLSYEILPHIVIMYKNNQIETEGTNPRTTYNKSQVQFSSHLNLNSSLINLLIISWPDGSISYIKSSYFKFQPIPSNKQQLTSIKLIYWLNISIEIHIDEDDGNSRVITGDVVKFDDEFVVKISESIFQDEVKKCRLVWNGEVIGRGIRLYFQQVKTSDIYSGIDLELRMKVGRENYCIFEFHPIPRFIEASLHKKRLGTGNMCCIGHPHGGPKMVTFGRCLDVSPEQFDNQYRQITQPGSDCKCKKVCCMKYSCKTCVGSSGSPVFPLHKEVDCSHGYTHFLGEKVENIVSNGELIENINIAWAPVSPKMLLK